MAKGATDFARQTTEQAVQATDWMRAIAELALSKDRAVQRAATCGRVAAGGADVAGFSKQIAAIAATVGGGAIAACRGCGGNVRVILYDLQPSALTVEGVSSLTPPIGLGLLASLSRREFPSVGQRVARSLSERWPAALPRGNAHSRFKAIDSR